MRRRLLLITALLATGCAAPAPGPAATPSAAGGDFPVTVGAVTLAKRPEKIVSLSPVGTEMLWAVGAGPQVTAVDTNSTYPPGVPTSELSAYQPNAEAIAAKSPDLVLVSTDINKIVDQLTALQVPVLMIPAAKTMDDTYTQLTDLGAATGHRGEAAAVVQRMRSEIARLVAAAPQRAKPLTYYYELDTTYYSVTSKTFVGSLFAQIGLVSVADAADPDGKQGGYPQLSAESIVTANPDLIFLANTKSQQQSAQTVAARPGWSSLAAVTNQRVVALDDDVASRWGPRVVDLLTAAVDQVAKVPA